MSSYPFHIVNVFSTSRWGGNPLAVFPTAEGLQDADMLAIARQFNLSETVFVFPSDNSAGCLRIFTPTLELPFAGHPTLGAASVMHERQSLPPSFTLTTQAGPIPLQREGERWVLTANPASIRPAGLEQKTVADMLQLPTAAIAEASDWVNTGSWHLLIHLRSRQDVLAARPDPALFMQYATLGPGRTVAYLWSEQDGQATVRLLFEQDGQILEDPGTGSACANLGGLLASRGARNLRWQLDQGEVIQRPNRLYLQIDQAGQVSVGGQVRPVGHGVFNG